MDQVIVAFESEKTCRRVKEILERSSTASCLICRSGDQVRRWVNEQHISAVICGYKLAEQSAEELLRDLPVGCVMLLLAAQSRLELVRGENLLLLPAPASRGALLEAVRTLLRDSRRETQAPPWRDESERALIRRAKMLLMERKGLTEEQAHRFLQKKSMDGGVKLAEVARMVLEDA